ncbi:MAG: TVP38/TMEM64 family protein [Cyanobacteriota bacterium]
MAQTRKRRLNSKTKLILGISLVATLIIAICSFNIQEFLQSVLIWVKNLGALGPIAFIAIYNLATVLFIPGSLLTMGGGVLFGLFWGSVYVFIAAALGATFAFLIGRYLSRDWVSRQIEGNLKFKAIDEAVGKAGLKIVLLTRLSPVFPFNLLNYVFGVTQVSLKDYVLGSLGILPGTVMYVYIGSLVGNLALLGAVNQPINLKTRVIQWVIRLLGFIATIGITVYITRIAQNALNKSISTGGIINETNRNP